MLHSLRINRDRLAGLLESQTRFIRIPDLYRDTARCTGVVQRQQTALLPSALPENVIDAAPGGQPVSFSVNGMGCVRLPVVLSCFVGQVPSVTVLSLSLPSATQVKSILP
jgi:hypothetical protein